MTVLIGVPTMGGVVKAEFAGSLATIIGEIVEGGRRFRYLTMDNSVLIQTRNYMLNVMMQDADVTHLFFLDSDVAIPRGITTRLLDADMPIAGVLYTRRSLDRARLAEALQSGLSMEQAEAAASSFAGNVWSEDGRLRVQDGFVRIRHLPFGCALIARSACAAMIEAGIAKPMKGDWLRRYGLPEPHWDFFQQELSEMELEFTEDFAFCNNYHRLPDARIVAIADAKVGHVGSYAYGGTFLDHLEASRTLAARRGGGA
ncbi:MAG: hypothetical protein AAGE90_17010 [Pseudomonadota bacterium]